jgi:2-isopropylmalate synthase
MLKNPAAKYRPFPPIDLPERQWPSRSITQAPIWCSVDLRDGNQALIEPMDTARKNRFFDLLVELGFKEIEICFPSASQTEFDFCRSLIENKRIPEDVTVQVLVQAREHLVARTFEALEGVSRAIVHVYNSTSELQRRVVFRQDRDGIREIAINGAKLLKQYAAKYPQTQWQFEYSPESFTGTEMDYAVDVCEAVMDVWEPTPQKPVILNLPSTVEMATANVYADQIEWCIRHMKNRDSAVISLHPHNDRGTGVAATELALMAGADRVEGTLFGNGERTGNVDIVTMAMNMYVQGVDPKLNFGDIEKVASICEECTQLPIHQRHPYAGDLVFTAFSGSHQDAIKKGFALYQPGTIWEIPYLPIDPKDLGRSYEPIIRVNSQSGKGGVSFLLERDYGIKMPRRMQAEFSSVIQKITDKSGHEVSSSEIWESFQQTYIDVTGALSLEGQQHESNNGTSHLEVTLGLNGGPLKLGGEGNGPIDAFVNALNGHFGFDARIADYEEYAIGHGSDASAVSIVQVQFGDADPVFGVGLHRNIVTSSLHAIVSAVNRALAQKILEKL